MPGSPQRVASEPSRSEALDAIVGGIGDVYVAAAHRDSPAGGLVGPEAGAEVELPKRVAGAAPLAEQAPGGREALDAVVGGVEHVDVSRAVHGEPVDGPELPAGRSRRSPTAQENARRGRNAARRG